MVDTRRLIRLAALAVCSFLTAGCGLFTTRGLDLLADNRLHFDSPAAHALVATPVTVSWSMPALPAGDYFAVFVDRAPVRPGQTLAVIADGDAYCQHTAGCPDAAYLAQRGVYTTKASSVSIPEIPDVTTNKDSVQLHTVVVVIMGPTGRRVGESAWERDIRLRRVGTT